MANVLEYANVNSAQRFEAKRSVLLATMGSVTSAKDRLGKLKEGLAQAVDIAGQARTRANAQQQPATVTSLKDQILAARKALLTARAQARETDLVATRNMADSVLGLLPE